MATKTSIDIVSGNDLMVASHCWLIISKVLWHSSEDISYEDLRIPIRKRLKISYLKWHPGGRLNIKLSSYQYRDSHAKDKTVSPTVLSLTWESPYLEKTVFILRRGPDPQGLELRWLKFLLIDVKIIPQTWITTCLMFVGKLACLHLLYYDIPWTCTRVCCDWFCHGHFIIPRSCQMTIHFIISLEFWLATKTNYS